MLPQVVRGKTRKSDYVQWQVYNQNVLIEQSQTCCDKHTTPQIRIKELTTCYRTHLWYYNHEQEHVESIACIIQSCYDLVYSVQMFHAPLVLHLPLINKNFRSKEIWAVNKTIISVGDICNLIFWFLEWTKANGLLKGLSGEYFYSKRAKQWIYILYIQEKNYKYLIIDHKSRGNRLWSSCLSL